ncbi:hypothetical protein [Qipengyuania sp. JC766]|uniref:hypothetical protein n=1 Tax=Qipengyuania sp. JC766 TaxID=3232139 RepID=UPI00345A6AAA
MAKKKNVLVGGGLFAFGNFLWGLYSHYTTARDLPDDVGRLREMLAEPTPELPWILALVGVGFVLWVWMRWSSDDDDDDNGDGRMSTKGNNSPVNQGGNQINADNNSGDIRITIQEDTSIRPVSKGLVASTGGIIIADGAKIDGFDVAAEATSGGSISTKGAIIRGKGEKGASDGNGS